MDPQPQADAARGGRRDAAARQRCRPDWPAIESDYRSGRHSLRQLAVMHGCAPSTIANKATRDGWLRHGAQAAAAARQPPPAASREVPAERWRTLSAALGPDGRESVAPRRDRPR